MGWSLLGSTKISIIFKYCVHNNVVILYYVLYINQNRRFSLVWLLKHVVVRKTDYHQGENIGSQLFDSPVIVTVGQAEVVTEQILVLRHGVRLASSRGWEGWRGVRIPFRLRPGTPLGDCDQGLQQIHIITSSADVRKANFQNPETFYTKALLTKHFWIGHAVVYYTPPLRIYRSMTFYY